MSSNIDSLDARFKTKLANRRSNRKMTLIGNSLGNVGAIAVTTLMFPSAFPLIAFGGALVTGYTYINQTREIQEIKEDLAEIETIKKQEVKDTETEVELGGNINQDGVTNYGDLLGKQLDDIFEYKEEYKEQKEK